MRSELAGFVGTCSTNPNGGGCLQPFTVDCFATGAPSGASGACLFGLGVRTTPYSFLGIDLLVDPDPLVAEAVRADASGLAAVPTLLLYWPPGSNGIAVQWVFLTGPGCTGAGPLTASAALDF